MITKVIFLDIDGVLNSAQSARMNKLGKHLCWILYKGETLNEQKYIASSEVKKTAEHMKRVHFCATAEGGYCFCGDPDKAATITDGVGAVTCPPCISLLAKIASEITRLWSFDRHSMLVNRDPAWKDKTGNQKYRETVERMNSSRWNPTTPEDPPGDREKSPWV